MRIVERTSARAVPTLFMSAMIDVVFLLLIFFLMTFKITAQEGDFQMAPLEGGDPGPDVVSTHTPTIHVRLLSANDGNLAGLRVNGRNLRDFDELTRLLKEIESPGRQSSDGGIDVVLDCDYALDYEHVIQTMTAVAAAGDSLKPQVRFAPAKTPAP